MKRLAWGSGLHWVVAGWGFGAGEMVMSESSIYRGSHSIQKYKGSLGRCGVLGWEAVPAEGSLKAGSPSPRPISIGFVLGAMYLPLYHLVVNVYPTEAPFVLFSPSLDDKGHGVDHLPPQGELVGRSLCELLLDHPKGSLLEGKSW